MPLALGVVGDVIRGIAGDSLRGEVIVAMVLGTWSDYIAEEVWPYTDCAPAQHRIGPLWVWKLGM